MELKQNPFSLYDFLGYFIPGAVFLISIGTWILLEENVCRLFLIFCPTQSETVSISPIKSLSWILPLGLVAISYVIGFALSITSSLIVEHYLILRKGYPSKYRFKPTQCFFSKTDPFSMLDVLCIFLAFPIVIFDIILGKLLGLERHYYKTFHEKERIYVKPRIDTIIKLMFNDNCVVIDDMGFNWHQYIYHYIYERGTNHAQKIQNYVALYGFSRTVSMVFVILSWLAPLALVFEWANYSIKACILHTLLFSILAYVFFFGFTKFFRRYTDEILMAAVAHVANSEQNKQE